MVAAPIIGGFSSSALQNQGMQNAAHPVIHHMSAAQLHNQGMQNIPYSMQQVIVMNQLFGDNYINQPPVLTSYQTLVMAIPGGWPFDIIRGIIVKTLNDDLYLMLKTLYGGLMSGRIRHSWPMQDSGVYYGNPYMYVIYIAFELEEDLVLFDMIHRNEFNELERVSNEQA